MWTAWQWRRLPRMDRRKIFRWPEDTSIGAVPLYEANLSAVGNRVMSVTSPMTVAAMTGPTPKTSVRLVPDALTAAVIFLRVSRSWMPGRRRSARCSPARPCQAAAMASAGSCGCEDRGGAGGGDVLAGAARDDLAQRCVQPAGGLAAEPGQLAVPPGPDPQGKSVIVGADLLADGRAERGDRD